MRFIESTLLWLLLMETPLTCAILNWGGKGREVGIVGMVQAGRYGS